MKESENQAKKSASSETAAIKRMSGNQRRKKSIMAITSWRHGKSKSVAWRSGISKHGAKRMA